MKISCTENLAVADPANSEELRQETPRETQLIYLAAATTLQHSHEQVMYIHDIVYLYVYSQVRVLINCRGY